MSLNMDSFADLPVDLASFSFDELEEKPTGTRPAPTPVADILMGAKLNGGEAKVPVYYAKLSSCRDYAVRVSPLREPWTELRAETATQKALAIREIVERHRDKQVDERIDGTKPHHPFIDYDLGFANDDVSEADITRAYDLVTSAVVAVMQTMRPAFSLKDLTVAEACGPFKISLHFVMPTLWCSDYRTSRAIALLVKERLAIACDEQKELARFAAGVDFAVYAKGSCFRTLWSPKFNPEKGAVERVKQPCVAFNGRPDEEFLVQPPMPRLADIIHLDTVTQAPSTVATGEFDVDCVRVAVARRFRDVYEIGPFAGERLTLSRKQASYCDMCHRVHQRRDAYVAKRGACYMWACWRAMYDEELLCRDAAVPELKEAGDSVRLAAAFGVESKVPSVMRSVPQGVLSADLGILDNRGAELLPDFSSASRTATVIQSRKGTGKTRMFINHMLARQSTKAREPRFVHLMYRKALSRETEASLGTVGSVTNYLDVKRHDIPLDRMFTICQIESARRIITSRRTPFTLILDECNGILRQIMTSKRGENDLFSVLQNLVTEAQHVVAFDADAGATIYELLREIRGGDIRFVVNTHQPHKGKSYYYTTLDGARAYIISALKAGKRVAVPSTSKREAKGLAERIAGDPALQQKRVKLYIAETPEEERMRDFKDVYSTWRSYDCVIYTSAVESGVSFVDPDPKEPHFHAVVTLCARHQLDASAVAQMEARVRTTNEHIIGFGSQQPPLWRLRKTGRAPTIETLRHRIAANGPSCSFLGAEGRVMTPFGYWQEKNDLKTRIFMQVALSLEQSRYFGAAAITSLFHNEGYNVIWRAPDDIHKLLQNVQAPELKKERAVFKSALKTVDLKQAQALIAAKDVEELEDGLDVEKEDDRRQMDRNVVERYFVRKTFAFPDAPEWQRDSAAFRAHTRSEGWWLECSRRDYRSAFGQWKELRKHGTDFHKALTALTEAEIRTRTRNMADGKETPDWQYNSHLWELRRDVCRMIGFDSPDDSSEIQPNEAPDAKQQLTNRLKDLRKRAGELCHDMRVKQDSQTDQRAAMKFANAVLAKCGLQITSNVKRARAGGGVRVKQHKYSITSWFGVEDRPHLPPYGWNPM